MGKRFINFKVSRVFKSCRSKHPSSLPSNPVPSSFLRLPPPNPTTTTPNKSHHFSLKRHVSSALLSARRSFSSSRPSHDSSRTQSSPSTTSTSSSRFRWEKQRKGHVIAKIPDNIKLSYNYDSTPPRRKIYNSAASDDDANHNDVVLLPPPPTTTKHHKRRRIPRRRRAAFRRNSTSSDSGLFSDDAEEFETLVSTTDSSTPRQRRRQTGRKSSAAAAEAAAGSNVSPSPARLSEFMRKMMPCRAEGEVVEGKVRDSFAVVKRSEDPYEDFRRSMAEMVVEKQMFDRKELEELLRCFLSLNTEHHHGAIVRAFVDIWEGLFCPPSVD